MLETVPVCVMRVAGDGTILAMDIAALDMAEAERAEQMVDESWYERVVPDARAACRDFIERASRGEPGSFECQITKRYGTPRTVVLGAVRAPVDADGAPSALVVMRDLDKVRELEAGLAQYRQNLEALETALSEAEATHRPKLVEEQQAERDNLERALQAAVAQCQQLSADHEAERAESQRELAARKAQEAAPTQQLQAIGRKDLNAAIGKLDPVLSKLFGEDTEFAVAPASQLDPVTVNPDCVEQLLLRLAPVVREAMPGGGIVRLGTTSVQVDDAHVREYTRACRQDGMPG